jgi:ribonuclease HI
MKKYVVHTDGSVFENSIGGYGCVVRCVTPGHQDYFEFNGLCPDSYLTSSKLELLAVINAIRHLPKNSDITVYTDSKHIEFGADRGISIWPDNNWISREDNFIKLKDVWEEFIVLKKKYYRIRIKWLKGHAHHMDNIRADTLAKMATDGKIISPYEMDKTFSVFIHFSRIPKSKNDFYWIFKIRGNDINYKEKKVEINTTWHDVNERITDKICSFLNAQNYHFANIYADSKNFKITFNQRINKFHFMHIRDKKINGDMRFIFDQCQTEAKQHFIAA